MWKTGVRTNGKSDENIKTNVFLSSRERYEHLFEHRTQDHKLFIWSLEEISTSFAVTKSLLNTLQLWVGSKSCCRSLWPFLIVSRYWMWVTGSSSITFWGVLSQVIWDAWSKLIGTVYSRVSFTLFAFFSEPQLLKKNGGKHCGRSKNQAVKTYLHEKLLHILFLMIKNQTLVDFWLIMLEWSMVAFFSNSHLVEFLRIRWIQRSPLHLKNVIWFFMIFFYNNMRVILDRGTWTIIFQCWRKRICLHFQENVQNFRLTDTLILYQRYGLAVKLGYFFCHFCILEISK